MRSPERRGEQGNRRRQHGVKGGPGGARIGIVSQEGRRGDRKQQEEGQDAERQTGHQRVAAGPALPPVPARAFSRLNATRGVTTEGTARHPLGRWPRNSEASRIEAKDRRTCGAKVNPIEAATPAG